MKRLLLVAVLAAAGALGAACDVSPPAATVGGATVTRSQLEAQLTADTSNRYKTYTECALRLLGAAPPASLTGSGDATVDAGFASYELETLVFQHLVESDLAARHQTVTAADLDSARADLPLLLSPTSTTTSDCGYSGTTLIRVLPGSFVDQQVRLIADQDRLEELVGHVDVSAAALAAYYAAHPAQFKEICLSDIAVTTQAQAQQAHDAIAKGTATFASEAQQVSIDTQSAADGGQLGCVPSSEVVNGVILDAIAGLAPGQVSQPTYEPPSSGGSGVWFILELDGTPQIPLSQAEPEIRQQLLAAANPQLAAEFTRITRHASVWVDPRYGSWSNTEGIVAPIPPKPAELPAPATSPAGSTLGLGASPG